MLSVKQQQIFLKHYYAYYKGAVDGISGSGTKAGIKLFQENHSLTADGIWGANTDAKAVEVAKKIQEGLNKEIKVETPIANAVEKALKAANVNSDKIKKITAYTADLLNEKAALLAVDGVIGDATIKAIKDYQTAHGLTVDGVVGLNTALELWGKELITPIKVRDWSLYPGFSRDEFVCKCGGKYCNGDTAEMDTALLDILQKIRDKYGVTIVTSGVRCPTHNRNVGGVGNSRHVNGKAADIYIKGCTVSGKTLVNYAYSLGCRYSYCIDDYAVHIDVY